MRRGSQPSHLDSHLVARGGAAPEGEVAVEVEDSDVLEPALAPRVVLRRRPRAVAVTCQGHFQNQLLFSSLSFSGEVTF